MDMLTTLYIALESACVVQLLDGRTVQSSIKLEFKLGLGFGKDPSSVVFGRPPSTWLLSGLLSVDVVKWP